MMNEFINGNDLDGGLREPLTQLTQRIGFIPTSISSLVSFAVELFTLSEGLSPSTAAVREIWSHSVRTGYLAALIAETHSDCSQVIWQSFAGGLLHDIGLLILLSQEAPPFWGVVELALTRGTNLQVLERECYGTTHAELGAALLSRWGGCQEVVDTIRFHDDPFQNSETRFCPASAVFLANLLEGGGIAQDSDGVPNAACEAYLLRLGLWDHIPYWQGRMRDLQNVSLR
ncbi:MAG: HDOD domain-containing protein [Nitrospira sp.]|nr:HDOD domain-containing protein [Nitrospira sp.]MCA9468089.1 HDOD domain-containing protein [Nitrospira sp.]MCA9475820.1 HDOD domain-containing protein [Nitrospira sp.]